MPMYVVTCHSYTSYSAQYRCQVAKICVRYVYMQKDTLRRLTEESGRESVKYFSIGNKLQNGDTAKNEFSEMNGFFSRRPFLLAIHSCTATRLYIVNKCMLTLSQNYTF